MDFYRDSTENSNMVSLNTNTVSMLASYDARSSSVNLRRSLERLASGSRINSSYDDAGGIAVSMKLAASIRNNQATQANINNTISLLQTQDGVLKAAERVVARLSELSMLALDVTKSTADVQNYNVEFKSLQSQLVALSEERFNGISLFIAPSTDGVTMAQTSARSISVVVSADGSRIAGISEVALNTDPWMNMLVNGFVSFTDPSNTGSRVFVPNEPQDIEGYLDTGGGIDLSQTTQVTQTYLHEYTIPASDFVRLVNVDGHAPSSTAPTIAPYSVTILSDSTGSGLAGRNAAGTYSLPQSNTRVTTPTYQNLVDNLRTGDLTFDPLLAGETSSISTTVTYEIAAGALGNYTSTAIAKTGTLVVPTESYSGTETLNSWTGNSLVSKASNASSGELTQATADGFVAVAKKAMQSLAQMRANNGAEQASLTYFGDTLKENQFNLQIALSKITDLDIAAETTKFARFNILQQSTIALQAQANNSSRSLLQLLI